MISGPALGGPYDGKWVEYSKAVINVDIVVPSGAFKGQYKYFFGCWKWHAKQGAGKNDYA
jgi:hypothetical protein